MTIILLLLPLKFKDQTSDIDVHYLRNNTV